MFFLIAREYLAFFDDPSYFDKQNSHVITFVPRRCRGHICDYAIPEMNDISSSHIFMETMVPTLTKEELYTKSTGVWHRKD